MPLQLRYQWLNRIQSERGPAGFLLDPALIAESLTFAFIDVRARKWAVTNFVFLINLRVRIGIWCKRELTSKIFDF